jgi:hypothetical protein
MNNTGLQALIDYRHLSLSIIVDNAENVKDCTSSENNAVGYADVMKIVGLLV